LTGEHYKKTLLWFVIGLILLLSLGVGFLSGWNPARQFRLISHYSTDLIREEAKVMVECADCHEAEDFHRCSTCHDSHGAVEFSDLPFYNLIPFTGDVPDPGLVQLDQILPYQDIPNTHMTLTDFLEEQGVTDFESVTITSWDGGFITIKKENLSDQALLLPFSDGIRFVAEDLHVSTWLKGLSRIIVVSRDRPLIINGERTSIGRLLLGPTRQITVESAKVMLRSEQDGKVRDALTAVRVEGAAVSDLLDDQRFSEVLVIDQKGSQYRFEAEEIRSAVLLPDSSGTTLVLPDKARAEWIKGVVEIRVVE